LKEIFWEPPWLAHPHPLLLLAASVGAGSLLISYHQLNAKDNSQSKFLWTAFVVSTAAGLLSGHSILTTALATVPWALFFALVWSDLYHVGLNPRKRSRIHSHDDTEKQQCSEPRKGQHGQDVK
jgi:hypothetical protein